MELKTAIRDHYETFLHSRHARFKRTPYLRKCALLSRFLIPDKIAYLRLEVVEVQRIPRYAPIERDISLVYLIHRDGTISYRHKGEDDTYEFYKQPLLNFLYESNFDIFVARREQEAKARIQARTQAIHEELAKTVWHPDRVSKMLETSGFHLIDAY